MANAEWWSERKAAVDALDFCSGAGFSVEVGG